jgi:hypothetical protein
MDLIERLRPKWRHPDPEVRAAGVRELEKDDQHRLGVIAQEDPDAHVRRIAIKKLDDATLLERLAGSDADPALRELAAERTRELLVAAAGSDDAPAACEAALARLHDERSLAAVATHARHERVREAALARITGERLLRDVVRGATDAAIRRAALERIADPAVLRSIAVSDCPPELALHALERIGDVDTLHAIAEHPTASKSVRQRARALLPAEPGDAHALGMKEGRARQLDLLVLVQALRAETNVLHAAERVHAAQREWRELAPRVEPRPDVAQQFAAASEAILADAAALDRRLAEVDHAQMAFEDNLAARAALCARVESLDGAEALRELAEAGAAWRRLGPVPGERGESLARRFAQAGEECERRHERWSADEKVRAERHALVVEAEALAGTTPPPKARAWKAIERRWTALAPEEDASEELVALRRRLASAGERLQRRRHESEQHQGEAQQENLTRLTALHTRLRELAVAEALRPSTARRALQAAEAALADLGPFPAAERRAAWTERLGEARNELLRRVRHEEETEEWRRWANVGAQEEIIAGVEALLESNALGEGVKLLGHLQEQWEAVATVTPDKSQALWERFRMARNELRRRCDAYLAENLEKKRALIAQAAPLGESTAWNETAAVLKGLQSEWKALGPVPVKVAQALWQEFREPCDRFFARRKEHFDKVDAERSEHAKVKAALCEQAEALAESTDWDATAAAFKQLQAEWKRGGAPPRAEAERLWQRFRAACDRFFDRHRRRGELAREAEVEKAQAICAGLEAVVASLAGEAAPAADEAGRQLDAAWGEWIRLDAGLLGDTRALDERLRAACEQLAVALPESLRGTRLDPAATRERREKLCARLEALAPATGEQPKLSLQEMALALRDRLATNTIAGGKGTQPTRRQDSLQDVERITASWARLGPALGDDGRALAERFDRARARLTRRET